SQRRDGEVPHRPRSPELHGRVQASRARAARMTHVADLLARDRPELSLTERRELDAHLASCGRCRDLQSDLAATDRLLRGREPDVTSPPFDRALHPRERAMPFVLATAGALVVP